MKKFATALLALSMAAIVPMVQVQAQELSLGSAIDNLQYRLTVEWDQKDLAVQQKIMSDFSAELAQLQKQGVSNEDIMNTLSARAFDGQTAKDLADLAKYAKANQLGEKQVHALVTDYANKTQKLGTSWGPGLGYGIALGVILAVVIVAAATGNFYVGGARCYDSCGYDYWGYYYCDTYCNY